MGDSYTELMAEAGLLLNRGRLAQALMTCETWHNEGRVSKVDASLVAARVNLDAARPAQALEKILEVSDLDTDHVQVDLVRGLCLFELVQFPEALATLKSVVRRSPQEADAHYIVGLIHELARRDDLAEPFFRQDRQLNPDEYMPRVDYSKSVFSEILHQAVAGLPEESARALQRYPIVVSDLPNIPDLERLRPRVSPRALAMILGGDPANPVIQRRPCLMLFKVSIERTFRDVGMMVTGIRRTVIREFAEAMGLEGDDPDS